jgi:hypothetical protein
MAFSVVADRSFRPPHLPLLRSRAIVLETQPIPSLAEELGESSGGRKQERGVADVSGEQVVSDKLEVPTNVGEHGHSQLTGHLSDKLGLRCYPTFVQYAAPGG